MADSLREFVADELWLAVAVLTLPVTSLVLLAGLEALAMAITILGWFALTPMLLFWGDELAAYLFEDAEPESGTDESQATEPDPLEELKVQYASGEIDDREFERRTERLLALDEVDASDADPDALLSGRDQADLDAGASENDGQDAAIPSDSEETTDVGRADPDELDVERER